MTSSGLNFAAQRSIAMGRIWGLTIWDLTAWYSHVHSFQLHNSIDCYVLFSKCILLNSFSVVKLLLTGGNPASLIKKLFLLGLNSRSPLKKEREKEKYGKVEEKQGWEGIRGRAGRRGERRRKDAERGIVCFLDVPGVNKIITSHACTSE
jgi:hypothetical protein